MPNTRLHVDTAACIGCGRCVNICPGGVLALDQDRHPRMTDFEAYGWWGCWQCEHCLAVCPKGPISIFDHSPEGSLPAPKPAEAAPVMDALVANRHSCRRFLDRPVPKQTILHLVDLLACAPNGGNKQQVEFLVADDPAQAHAFRDLAYACMDELMEQDVFPERWDRASFEDLKRREKTVRPDMLLCGAPHFLVPHAPLTQGEPRQDVMIAAAYFELLCHAHGLGACIMTFPVDVLTTMPDIRARLGIPENHHVGCFVCFGYPEIPYARGTQRHVDEARIQRLTI